MRIGYFDCFSGASGDMIVASLIDAGFDAKELEEHLEGLGLGKIRLQTECVMRGGIRARSFRFESSAPKEPLTYKGVVELLETSKLSEAIKASSLKIFDLLASAEASVHGIAKEDVHFHEVGAIDSIVDIVAASVGLESLGLAQVISSPITLGMGSVECQHGTLPVPSPATLELVKGLPIRGWKVDSELTTPTGAAILKAFASYFGEIPPMEVKAVGYGAGTKEISGIPNILRFILGERLDYDKDRILVVETNIDDMNPEIFSHLIGDLIAMGALDAWVTSVMMKKGRPGFNLTVLAQPEKLSRIASHIFTETTTSGLRINEVSRYKLKRRIVEVETRFGKIKAKVFDTGKGQRCMPEYEDCLRVARTTGLPVREIIEDVKNAFRIMGDS